MFKIKNLIIMILASMFLTGTAIAQTFLINETFGTVPPSGWTNSGTSQGTTGQDDSNSLLYAENNNSISIITSPVTDPDRLTFYHETNNNGFTGTFNIYYDTSPGGSFSNQLVSITNPTTSWAQSATELSLLEGTYYFKLERLANSKNKKDFYVDVFQVTQSIKPSTTTLTGFVYEPSNGPSPEQSFTVSGADLTNDITITPPTNYEISTLTGVAFTPTDPITLTQSGGSVSSTPIYVRLKSGLSEGSYNGENITISSTGKINKTVSCSGDVRQAINPSVETLSNFNYDPGSGPSSEQSFTVSGQDLTANISITPPTNYEISTGTGVAFTPTDPITLTQSGGLVSSTTIYVRLKSGLSSGSYSPENITLSSTDKISRTVACNGFVGPMVLNVKVFLEGGLW